MLRYKRRVWILAASLAALAGYVDAIGFLATGGRFVSFMSGNTTRIGVEAAAASAVALETGGLLLAFVSGVVLGSLLGRVTGIWRRPAALLLVSGFLACAAGLDSAGLAYVGLLLAAGAMGAENTVFERDGEVSIGLTYMTGTLVKLGQRLAEALTGGRRAAFLPYLLLWLGLACGALGGAFAYPIVGLSGLWFAALAAAMLAAVAALLD
ncbi:YoaK family protein [Antarcticirhabdus aurantiaca]|uniref:YoaK family protein n=1 Tax=Antarcticirhabdus aurantiaca TaxID=2606717 RepID=A0ACD4NPC5_9HYPH|nr:YoaK family protein [Antarcticirhabdus aurantiaca]WAJ28562.1 YoaK family protein [Jeongeuplla avenae]